MRRPPRLLVPFLALRHVLATTSIPNTGDQPQAFLFGFTTSSLILPVTYSCPTPLTLSQLTTTNNPNAPDPSAPYTMVMLVHEQLEDGAGVRYERMYSASMNVGDMSAVKSINHPWMNGTQFIACMWSANGVSGGCQVSGGGPRIARRGWHQMITSLDKDLSYDLHRRAVLI
jgi:hypothetical protein